MSSLETWFKETYETVKNFLTENFLLFLILVSAVIIIFSFIFARICTSNNYYAALGRKFKKLNVIIRDNQIKEDREKFLIRFNKTVKKPNKKFASAWNSYLLDNGQTASAIFGNTKFDKNKKGFFNFFLIFSWVLSFCAITLILTYKKFDFTSSDSLYIFIAVPIFIITLGLLFNLIYVSVRNKQRNDMLSHLEFFVNNIDESIKGFAKSDFELCGAERTDNIKENSPNVITYEDYEKLNEGDNREMIDAVNSNLADDKTKKAIEAAMLVESQNTGVDLEQKIQDEEKVLQLQEEDEIDDSKEKLLNNLKRLKNLEVLTNEINEIEEDNQHPFEDVDMDKKEEIEKELTEMINSKKEELDSQLKGEGLTVLNETPVSPRKTVKRKTTSKKKSEIAKALDGLKKAKTDAKANSKNKQTATKASAKKVAKTVNATSSKPKTTAAKKTVVAKSNVTKAPAKKVETKKPVIKKTESKTATKKPAAKAQTKKPAIAAKKTTKK